MFTSVRFIGRAKHVWDLDWVAVVKREKSKRSKKCGGYTGGSITLELPDSTVRIYDRRKGTELASKTFPASGRCPRTAYVGKKRKTSSFADRNVIDRWVRARLARGK